MRSRERKKRSPLLLNPDPCVSFTSHHFYNRSPSPTTTIGSSSPRRSRTSKSPRRKPGKITMKTTTTETTTGTTTTLPAPRRRALLPSLPPPPPPPPPPHRSTPAPTAASRSRSASCSARPRGDGSATPLARWASPRARSLTWRPLGCAPAACTRPRRWATPLSSAIPAEGATLLCSVMFLCEGKTRFSCCAGTRRRRHRACRGSTSTSPLGLRLFRTARSCRGSSALRPTMSASEARTGAGGGSPWLGPRRWRWHGGRSAAVTAKKRKGRTKTKRRKNLYLRGPWSSSRCAPPTRTATRSRRPCSPASTPRPTRTRPRAWRRRGKG